MRNRPTATTRFRHCRQRDVRWFAALLVVLSSTAIGAAVPRPNPSRPSSVSALSGADRSEPPLVRLRQSAEGGDVQAAADLCQLYSGSPVGDYPGLRVGSNDAVAFNWCLQAASRGHLRASATLGAMYYAGKGIPKDFSQAIRWTRPAATAGVSEAQFLLGVMLIKGQGTYRDERQAFSWFQKAAEQGHTGAQKFIADSSRSR